MEEYKMISFIEGPGKIIDMRKKSCIYVGLPKFKDTVSFRSSRGLKRPPFELVCCYY
jgi:hypothetical protein